MSHDERLALEQAALRSEHVRPDNVRVGCRHAHRLWSAVLEQGADDSVQPLDLTQNTPDVALDHRIVAHTETKELRRRRDAEERVAKLTRDARRNLADCLEPTSLSQA